MEAVPKSVGAITLFIEDVQRSKAFYESAFDTSAIYEDENSVAFGFENIVRMRLAVANAMISSIAGVIGPAVVIRSAWMPCFLIEASALPTDCRSPIGKWE